MDIHLIWAEGAGGVIGAGGALPWHLPEDLAAFRARTQGAVVVMGRGTWESLPARSRPLPGRLNLVLTRRTDWFPHGSGTVSSVEQVLALADVEDVWVIGGGAVFAALVQHAAHVVCTVVDHTVAGDAYAPPLGAAWTRTARVPATGWRTSSAGLRYVVEEHRRTS